MNSDASAAIKEAISGNFGRAIEVFLTTRSKSLHAKFARDVRREAQRRWPQADEEDWQNWINMADSAPEDVEYNLSVALWGVDLFELAILLMKIAVEHGDNDAELMLGESLLYLRMFDDADLILRRIAQEDGRDANRAAGLLGSHYFRDLNRFDLEVIDLLTRSGDSDPKFPVELAMAYDRQGNRELAVSLLKEQTAKGNVLAPIVLGNLYSETSLDQSAAEASYLRGVDLGDAYSAYNLAALLFKQSRFEESEYWLKYAAEHGDESARERIESQSRAVD